MSIVHVEGRTRRRILPPIRMRPLDMSVALRDTNRIIDDAGMKRTGGLARLGGFGTCRTWTAVLRFVEASAPAR